MDSSLTVLFGYELCGRSSVDLSSSNCFRHSLTSGTEPLQHTGMAIQNRHSPRFQNRFSILVWPYKTDILRDFELYRKLGIRGFQIDRGAGAGQEKKVEFSIKQNIPYYVGHAADKGFLHLTRNNRKAVTNQHGLVIRPHSLADPRTLAKMKDHLRRNVTATKNLCNGSGNGLKKNTVQ